MRSKLASVIAISGLLLSQTALAACPDTLPGISGKLPNYADSDLQTIRQQMISFNARDHFDSLAANGYSKQEIAAAALQQSQEADRALGEATQCVTQTASDPQAAITALNNGSFAFTNSPFGLNSACGKAYAAAYLMVVANRETAVVLACMARE